MDEGRDRPIVFTFTAGSIPPCRLSFPRPSPPPEKPRLKRHRPLTDVDGEESSGKTRKKKRRLRLHLITSRLSSPFAAPSTHIVDRGSSKIAIWAKQRALGRNELRKAAIMNHVRMRAVAAQEAKQRQMERARKEFMLVVFRPSERSKRVVLILKQQTTTFQSSDTLSTAFAFTSLAPGTIQL